MGTMQLVWLGLMIFFIVVETVTVAVVSIWFCAGALAALLVSFIWPGAWVAQVIVFFLVSFVSLLALRPLADKFSNKGRTATNADASIGKMCQVVSEVQPGRFGRVKLEGLEWAAKSDYILPVGSWCRVIAIDGVKLVVIPPEQNGPASFEGVE